MLNFSGLSINKAYFYRLNKCKYMLRLIAKTREAGKKLGTFRKEGHIPAVIYGRGQASLPIVLEEKEFNKVIFSKFFIQNIAFYPITSKPIHIDLYKVRMDEKLTAEIPLVFGGESEVIRNEGGVLVKNLHEVEIKCLPGDLPSHLEVNISSLKTFADKIFVKDIKLPAGVEIISPPVNEIVALVEEPRTEEELKALEEEVIEDISKVEAAKVKAEEEQEEEKEIPDEKKVPEAKEKPEEK
jgi:large subunit ribosomal protein L25